MAAVTIGVAMQAFAAFDVYLAKRGVVPGGAPSLLSAEESYAWHLLDAVPFLHVTQTLRWGEPAVLRDVLSGLMLLVFKVAVIAPFIGVVLAGYHMLLAVVAVVFVLALQVDVEAARGRWRMLGPLGAYAVSCWS
jgi:hypothetical protein